MTKMVALRDLKQGLSGYVARLKKGDRLIVTVRGKPRAQLTPLAPDEDVFIENDPVIWEMLAQRWDGPRVSAAEARERLGLVSKPGPRKKGASTRTKTRTSRR